MTKTYLNGIEAPNRAVTRVGALSGETFTIPDVDSGYPVASWIDASGATVETFDRGAGRPDTRSDRLKFGVLVPVSNCTMESELWDVIYGNRDALAGVGLHTSNIITPAPRFGSAEELATYERQFGDSLLAAADAARLAEPQYLILGFSMEHFHASPAANAKLPDRVVEHTGLGLATWAKAARAALEAFGARRLGLLCPFDPSGLSNAIGFFEAIGFEVVTAAGLGCASGIDVGHVPDDYKERILREHLLREPVDAIVVGGTNLSSLALAERLEPELGVPIVGSNQTLLWYALRENGIDAPLHGASRLLREH